MAGRDRPLPANFFLAVYNTYNVFLIFFLSHILTEASVRCTYRDMLQEELNDIWEKHLQKEFKKVHKFLLARGLGPAVVPDYLFLELIKTKLDEHLVGKQ